MSPEFCIHITPPLCYPLLPGPQILACLPQFIVVSVSQSAILTEKFNGTHLQGPEPREALDAGHVLVADLPVLQGNLLQPTEEHQAIDGGPAGLGIGASDVKSVQVTLHRKHGQQLQSRVINSK